MRDTFLALHMVDSSPLLCREYGKMSSVRYVDFENPEIARKRTVLNGFHSAANPMKVEH